MRDSLKNFPRVLLARNPSWRESALLGLSNGVLWAPTVFCASVKPPLALLLAGLGLAVTGLAQLALALTIFAVMRLVVVTAGLLGRLKHDGWGLRTGP
jgi:hypothetical protein